MNHTTGGNTTDYMDADYFQDYMGDDTTGGDLNLEDLMNGGGLGDMIKGDGTGLLGDLFDGEGLGDMFNGNATDYMAADYYQDHMNTTDHTNTGAEYVNDDWMTAGDEYINDDSWMTAGDNYDSWMTAGDDFSSTDYTSPDYMNN